MVEISNSDIDRILICLDIATDHYKAQRGLRNQTHAWAIAQLKDKINRKVKNNSQKQKLNYDKK